MFENFKRNRKLNAFRKGDVTCKEYKPGSRVIELEAAKWNVSLAIDLIDFDGKLQLAFSGDLIASDGEALARVMKTMWNKVLPQFGEDKEMRLREQLGKLLHPVSPEPVETGSGERGSAAGQRPRGRTSLLPRYGGLCCWYAERGYGHCEDLVAD